MRVTAFVLLIATAFCSAAVEPHPVRVRLEPVVQEDSPVWELFDFLETKVIRYRIVAEEPVSRFTAKVTFRLRDSSRKLVETDHLDSRGCMSSHAMSSAILTFLISPEKAFISISGCSDRISTKFLQRVSGEYHYWKPSPDLENPGDTIDIYAVYSGSKKVEIDKTASIELKVGAETF